MTVFDRAREAAARAPKVQLSGAVKEVTGLVIEAHGPLVPVGTPVEIGGYGRNVPAQVVGFREKKVLLMPYGEIDGISPGATVTAFQKENYAPVSESYLGKVVDGFGRPIDGSRLPPASDMVALLRAPPNPVTRSKIKQPLDLGVRAINTMLTTGVGQRLGIMAGSGVGKSTLLGMIAQHSTSEINVIALIGERGREVREFIERDLGPEGLRRSIVVVATGDQPPLLRLRAAYLATAYAEYFRDQGKKVVFMLDSVTRLAMAQREIGLSIGEPPSTKGYTPSVFSMLPKLLERAGNGEGDGSITALYTVLVEGDDMNEPIADAVRGILDGHVVLSRDLAGRGHYPAIEILESTSRVVRDIVPEEALQLAALARDVLATYRDTEDLITIGAYKPGQNERVDRAVALYDPLVQFLRQSPNQKVSMEDSWRQLKEIFVTQ